MREKGPATKNMYANLKLLFHLAGLEHLQDQVDPVEQGEVWDLHPERERALSSSQGQMDLLNCC
jgi:hypothetical protein